MFIWRTIAVVLLGLSLCHVTLAQPASDAPTRACLRWADRTQALTERARARPAAPTPTWVDVAYGAHPQARLDVYRASTPAQEDRPAAAPVIVMVHGGAWCIGDKRLPAVTAHKAARWTPRGLVFVAVGYPLVPDGASAREQARQVAQAIAFVQHNADRWGGDGQRVIVIGHSAGAHLVSLIHADPALRAEAGMRAVLGTLSLDAGALDVPTQMRHVGAMLKPLYLAAFGAAPAQWVQASPLQRLQRGGGPWLGVCGHGRAGDPCGQAQAYARAARALGGRAEVLPMGLGHAALNQALGADLAYTEAVEAFMASLDAEVARRLHR